VWHHATGGSSAQMQQILEMQQRNTNRIVRYTTDKKDTICLNQEDHSYASVSALKNVISKSISINASKTLQGHVCFQNGRDD